MLIRLSILITFLFQMGLSYGQGNIYIWNEIDPGWKNRSVEHWNNVKGYGKSVPVEMSTRITNYYNISAREFELSLQERLIFSELGGKTVKASNPGSIRLENEDLFLDLQCMIVEISDEYPNFRTRKIYIEPVIKYLLSLYNSRGEMVGNREVLVPIDYKNTIRPLLRGLPEHKRDIEIVRYSYAESFSAEILDGLISDINELISSQKDIEIEADPDKFRKVIGLVFDKRKLQFPDDYLAVNFERESTGILVTDNFNTAIGGKSDPKISGELEELISGSSYYALIIGINDYLDPSINDLAEPLNDASRLQATLLSNYIFEERNMILLENPTRDELIHSFDNLAQVVTENDNLLVFYAGHGLWDEQLNKGFWIPSDASSSNRANWFSNSDLRDYIGGIKAKHTLLISDACFGGGIFKTREVFTGVTPATLELYKLPSRKAMTSGAMTTVPDKSVFIEYLIKRLEESTTPFLSSEQLFSSFKIAVINNSSTSQVPQFGEIRETGDEGGDFLFIRRDNK